MNNDQANTPNSGKQDYNFIDNGWTNSLLMENNHQLLYDMDFPTHVDGATPTNNIVQSIQFQNHVSPDIGSMTGDEDIQMGLVMYPNSGKPISSVPLTHPQPHINPLPQPLGSQQLLSSQNTKKRKISIKEPSASAAFGATGNPSAPGAPEETERKKTRRPCDHCRRRKTRCVITPGAANCVQCEAKSLPCTFTAQALKRKPVDIDDSTAKKNSDFFTSGNIKAPNVPIRDVAPIQDYSSMNNSLLKKTLSLQFPRSSFYIGPSSYIYDINLLNLIIDSQNRQRASSKPNSGKIEQINLSDSISLRKVSEEAQFILKDDQSPQSYQTMLNDVDAIEKFVAPHGQILIDLYFRIIHPSYPILHKKVFLEKYSRTHREFSAPLLAAVYVLAIQWWDYDPSLNRFPKPNVEMILKIGLNNYLLEILKRPKLSAVQAGLLLLQCKHIVRVSKNNKESDLNNNQPNSGDDLGYSDWVLCAQVTSLAEELGLGLDCTDWKLPKWERGLRKRLAWAVFIEDKWLALKNSRPSHIHESNWIVTSLIEEDFPEKHGDGDLKEGSSDIDNGKKIFMCLIELSLILSQILDDFYSMKSIDKLKGDISEILKLAKPIQLKLRNWYHSLPVSLQMSSVQPRKLCSNGYLQLAYFATELTLHRKIITSIYEQTMNGRPIAKELVNVCRSAAKTRLLAAIDFVRDLKPEHIHSFWHSSSASNFTLIGTFASILYISAPTNEESTFFKDQIFNYRWILKISSKGFDQVGDALLQLDLVLTHIPGLLNEGGDLPMVLPTVQDIPIQRPDSAQSSRRNLSNPAISPSAIASPLVVTKAGQTASHSPVSTNSRSAVNNNQNNSKSKHSPQSSYGLSPKETRNRGNSFNNSSVDPSSPNTVKSDPLSPAVASRSPLTNRNND